MSDGVRLAADIWLPDGGPLNAPRPVILHFTPYNRNWCVRKGAFFGRLLRSYGADVGGTRLFNTRTPRYLRAFLPRGYALLSVDVRGCGASFGSRQVDFADRERLDLVEVANWCRQQPWCDGWLASGGISYDGMAATSLAADSRLSPPLAAIFPLFAPQRAYEDLGLPGGLRCTGFAKPYGAFRLSSEHNTAVDSSKVSMGVMKRALYSTISGGTSDALGNAEGATSRVERLMISLLRPLVAGRDGGVAPVGADDAARALRDAAVAEHATNWDHGEALNHVSYSDDVLQASGVEVNQCDPATTRERLAILAASGTAIYSYAGWFDSGSMASALRIHSSEATGGTLRKLTVGPWNHGARAACSPAMLCGGGGTKPKFDMYADVANFLDEVRMASTGADSLGLDATVSDASRSSMAALAKPCLDTAPIHYFLMGREAWQASQCWPPEGVDELCFFLSGGRTLTRTVARSPAEGCAIDFTINADARSAAASRWNLVAHILEQPVDYGNRLTSCGVLAFESAPLLEPLVITGTVRVSLDLTLHDGCDAAVFAYLEDVSDGATASYVTEGCLRAAFARAAATGTCTFKKEEHHPWPPASRAIVPIEMQPVAYEFKQGHRVRLALAGADADNFEQPPDAATAWTVHLSASSSVKLPALA